MFNIEFWKFSILFLYLFSYILCIKDSISLNKVGCIFIENINPNYEMLSFVYREGYYRAIHATYGNWVSKSVKMKLLGDSNKDIFLNCYISLNYAELYNYNLLEYHIPCTLTNNDIQNLKEGTYCLEIVKKLIGDITSADFCIDTFTFKVKRKNNLPILTIVGFSNNQVGCIIKNSGEQITLIATVQNMMSISQDFDNLGIGLSNTEVPIDNIVLSCKIEGNTFINSNDNIICNIPNNVPEGYYSVFYSDELLNSNRCPVNIINQFNSLYFGGDLNKLHIVNGDNIKNIEAMLINISFVEPSYIPGQFNLTFYIQKPNTTTHIKYENIQNKFIGIQLIDNFGNQINTNCELREFFGQIPYFGDLIVIDYKFSLICKANYYEKDIKYSLLIKNKITIGYDKNAIICSNDKYSIYNKIIIPSNEYDFLIIFGDNSANLDCHQTSYGFYFQTKSIEKFCGSCSSNCLSCENYNFCNKCVEGFSKKSNKCELIKDKINYNKFTKFNDYIPFPKDCGENRRLFSLIFSYIINKGEYYSVESETYNNNIYAKNNNERIGLNCIIEVNPDYIPSEQYYGTCKKETCNLLAYISCFFNENISNGDYEIEESSSNLGKLIKKAEHELNNKISFTYIETSIIPKSENNNIIEVVYLGNTPNSNTVYLCPDYFSKVTDCSSLKDCKRKTYNETNLMTKFECSNEINSSFNSGCQNFEYIMMLDECNNFINESFHFRYCHDSSFWENNYYSSRMPLIILFIIFFIF